MKVAVVGGGISGLAAAWDLHRRAEVTVFDPGPVGGKLRTEPFEGRPVDCGPDAFITRQPHAVELCAEVGVDDLVAPEAGRALIWSGGRLRALPEGLVMGVPARLGPVLWSGLLSPTGVLRAAADLVLPRRRRWGDVSVRSLVAARFGAQVADRLVDPLVGSIHAGRTDELSAEATVPQLLAAAARSRSLLLGLRAMSPPAESSGPLFLAPRGGTAQLVGALTGRLVDAGVTFMAEQVGSVRSLGGAGVDIGGRRFDGCILAVAAGDAARLLGEAAPGGLGAIATASVALVTVGAPEIDLPAGVNGVLVPRREGRLMTACSFASNKWPHWARPGRTLLRVSAGRFGDSRVDDLDDTGLVDRLAAELQDALGPRLAPDSWRVSRWSGSFPQYRVGHLGLVAAIEDELARTVPSVALCGASYRGVGIPACIASGRAAARAVCPPSVTAVPAL